MWKLLLSFFMVCKFSGVQSQNLFSANYNAPWTTVGNDIDILNDFSLITVNGNAVVKTDSLGNHMWAKYYDFYCNKVITIDSFIYIFGYDANDIVIAKVDTAGNLSWCRRYNLSNGISDYEELNDAIKLDNENIVVLSSIYHSDSSELYSKINIMKMDLDGDVFSSINYSADTASSIAGRGLHLGANSSIWVDGTGFVQNQKSDFFIMQVDSLNNPTQSLLFGTATNERILYTIHHNDKILCVGYNDYGINPSFSLPIIVQLDISLVPIWSNLYDLSCNLAFFNPVCATYVNEEYLFNRGSSRLYMDTLGNIRLHEGRIASSGIINSPYESVLQKNNVNYYVGGYGTPYNILGIAKSDSIGYNGCLYDSIISPCVSNLTLQYTLSNVISEIGIIDTLSFSSVFTRPPPNKVLVCSNALDVDHTLYNKLHLPYPNPNGALFYFDNCYQKNVDIKLYNLTGEMVYSCSTNLNFVNVSSLSLNGFYILSVASLTCNYHTKVLINP